MAAATSPPTAVGPDGATATVAAALARLRATAAQRPGFGHALTSSTTTLVGPLRCVSHERHAVIDTDLAKALGGDASAPSPTTLVRSALGACLAMGYRLRAAELGVELTDVRVVVETETELSGMLETDADAPPGFAALRYRVEIGSPAPEAEVERIVELGDRLSPVLDMLTRAHTVERTISIERA
jgi:uncharacterized OsmC-like protein